VFEQVVRDHRLDRVVVERQLATHRPLPVRVVARHPRDRLDLQRLEVHDDVDAGRGETIDADPPLLERAAPEIHVVVDQVEQLVALAGV
jgi:hypothetical protein